MALLPQRKIIHVDMDCFYAAIEIRDNPSLADKPVGVGGNSDKRGVLCTCNYIARKYGVRSAMPTAKAFQLCRDLIVLPVNMKKYREAAALIHQIFFEYTDLVEPLSLDEAYLDVTASAFHQGSATLIAKEIRKKIFANVNITASAGVAPNKFLAKIASGWHKPNGLFVIRPQDIDSFVRELPIKELFGVGKVTAEKLHVHGYQLCADLHNSTLLELCEKFGKLGNQLYEQSRGIDNRPVTPNRIRKSLSVEETFATNRSTIAECLEALAMLHQQLVRRLKESAADRVVKNQFVKIKFSNFTQQTMERVSTTNDYIRFEELLRAMLYGRKFEIRLLGLGVHFQTENVFQHSLL